MKVSESLRRRVIKLIEENRRVEAVKIVQQETRAGLKNSKDYVDELAKELAQK